MLKMEVLEESVKKAKELGHFFMATIISTEGYDCCEVIINPYVNFDAKLEYFKKAYDENLVLKSFSGIRIVGVIFANTYQEIEDTIIKSQEIREGIHEGEEVRVERKYLN